MECSEPTAHDTLGRKIEEDDPNIGRTLYEYDAGGNLVERIDPLGQKTLYFYDGLNRVTQKTYSNTQDPAVNLGVTYTYDNPALGANGIGLLHSITNGIATTTHVRYDAMGRPVEVARTLGAYDFTTLFAYDIAGLKTSIVNPENSGTTAYAYYPGTRLIQRVYDGASTDYAVLSRFNPEGKTGRIDYGNGTTTDYRYDPHTGWMTGVDTIANASGAQLLFREYGYSKAGDMERIEIRRGESEVVFNYTYDALHRLKTEESQGVLPELAYSYGPTGNILSKSSGGSGIDYEYDPAHPHRVQKVLGTFPKEISFAERNLRYDAESRIARIEDTLDSGSVAGTTFYYDGEGKRAAKQSESESTLYISNYYEVVKDNVSWDSKETRRFIFAGDLRIAVIKQVTNPGISYFHKDHLGSTLLVTDGNVTPLQQKEFMPFGLEREGSDSGDAVSAYKFTDQEHDAETGLYNYDARFYDPVIGRFVSADTIIPNRYDPQTLNRYSYCRNNPLIYTDPDGHFHIGVAIGVVSGAISGYTSGIQSGSIKAGIIGGIAGALAGGLVGSVNAGVSGSVAGVVGRSIAASIVGGATARGTAAAVDATQKGKNPVEAGVKAAADPAAVTTDAVAGAAGALGGVGLGAAGVNTSGTASALEKAAAAGFAGTIERGVNNLSNSAQMVENGLDSPDKNATKATTDPAEAAEDNTNSGEENDDE